MLLASAEDAGRAVDMFNGYSWQTRILEVRPDRNPPDLSQVQLPGSGPSSGVPTPFGGPVGSPFAGSPMPYSGPGSSALAEEIDFSNGLRPGSAGLSTKNLFVGNVSSYP